MFSFFKKYKLAVLFFLILVVAIFFRFYNLQNVPPSASLDEATIGWNAYSLLQTGHDEYGYHFPMLLRAYDDYRPALYVYLVIPFVKLFGLTTLSVRLPSAILSLLGVVAIYFLTKNILISYKYKNTIALLSMLLLAISPWHIYISRLGHEANAGFAFFIFFLLFFLDKKFILAFIFFALSFSSYQAEKVILPVLGLCLALLFWRSFLKRKKQVIIGIIFASIILIPYTLVSLQPTSLERLRGTSIFNPSATWQESHVQQAKLQVARIKKDMWGRMIYSNQLYDLELFVRGYISHFEPKWLFTNGGNESFKVPGIGLFYTWEFPFLILGFPSIFFLPIERKIRWFMVFWLVSSPLASAITTDFPHAMRAFTLLPILSILSSFGIISVVLVLVRYAGKTVSVAFLFFMAFVAMQSVSVFFVNYFEVFPITDSRSFQYAFAKTIPFVTESSGNYQHIVISNKNNLYQSYMFYLFYTKYDPKEYAKGGGTKSGGYNESHVIGNVAFRPIVWGKEDKQGTLFVGNPQDFPTSISSLSTFYYLDGTPGVTIVGQK